MLPLKSFLSYTLFLCSLLLAVSCSSKKEVVDATDDKEQATENVAPMNDAGQISNLPKSMGMTPDEWVAYLNLDENQETEFLNVMESNQQTFLGLREQFGDDREKLRNEMMRLRQDRNNKLKEILTADQYEKFTKKNRSRFRNRKGQ